MPSYAFEEEKSIEEEFKEYQRVSSPTMTPRRHFFDAD